MGVPVGKAKKEAPSEELRPCLLGGRGINSKLLYGGIGHSLHLSFFFDNHIGLCYQSRVLKATFG